MRRGGRLTSRASLDPGCGKRRYRSQLAAEKALARISGLPGADEGKVPQRAYECPKCAYFHLTSLAPAKWTSSASASPSTDTGPTRKTRRLVLERDGYACVCCGRSVIGQVYSLQHRKRRSQGGDSSAPNLLTVLGDGTTGCHARIDSRRDPHDEARGYTVRSWQDPILVPVMVFSPGGSGVTGWPTEDGRYVFEAPAEAAS